MNPFLLKMAQDYTREFGFCPIVVTEKGSYIMPIHEALEKLEAGKEKIQKKLESLRAKVTP